MSDAPRMRPRQFRWYLGGHAAWFTSFGIQMILFPWLVAVVLQESAQRVGIAQMAVMAPAIVFMLYGGAVADHADCRGLLLRYQILATVPPLALVAVMAAGALSYRALLVYGFAMGTMTAFVVPARDTLLSRVVRHGRERAIAITSGVQFICQLVGIAAAGFAERIGAFALLLSQAVILVLGAFAVSRLSPAPPAAVSRHGESPLGAMRDGLRAVLLSLAWGSIVLVAMSVPGPLSVFALICLGWGVGAGVVLTQGRIIVQLETPESHRARALAVFQLGFTGGSPIGALGMGYLAGQVGPRSAVLYPAAAMAVVLTVLFRRSGLWGHTATSAMSTPARS